MAGLLEREKKNEMCIAVIVFVAASAATTAATVAFVIVIVVAVIGQMWSRDETKTVCTCEQRLEAQMQPPTGMYWLCRITYAMQVLHS